MIKSISTIKKKIISKKIKSIMASVFSTSTKYIKDSSSINNIKTWDSQEHMNLVSALEKEFKINFSNAEIGEITNFKIINSFLSKKIANKK